MDVEFRRNIYEKMTGRVAETYGSFDFFELDSQDHKYFFTTLVDITSPHSSVLFPQFMLEAILRQVTDDSEFEFKTKSTAFPIQENIKQD